MIFNLFSFVVSNLIFVCGIFSVSGRVAESGKLTLEVLGYVVLIIFTIGEILEEQVAGYCWYFRFVFLKTSLVSHYSLELDFYLNLFEIHLVLFYIIWRQ